MQHINREGNTIGRPRKNPVEVPGQEKACSTPAAEPADASTETTTAETTISTAAEPESTITPSAEETLTCFDMATIANGVLNGEFDDKQTHAVRKMLPFQNLFFVAPSLNMI
ncbi:hypothetical protein LU631_16630 [Erwinia tracheiphila]|uniref:Uncharacterized protein n=1 Tax=Erwinia tracheiphila TaxID=65700 RepID=A0A0M2KCA6_9GAMM|nr:hypothetical protein [Erwinia tracheiphila]EOS96627.1 hypothetical protein ETR_01801 [Erwinia tracheiphila PSU-1]KKF34893.1 hypothetical protein SY86_04735 [Erwinia tracheiphila]UIA86556.1 hypothetical protein LU631_16630 [Erwinia tracheiphila]UIA94909.1 hypothetical protein LU633_15090 [Erwinia tracheiphila]